MAPSSSKCRVQRRRLGQWLPRNALSGEVKVHRPGPQHSHFRRCSQNALVDLHGSAGERFPHRLAHHDLCLHRPPAQSGEGVPARWLGRSCSAAGGRRWLAPLKAKLRAESLTAGTWPRALADPLCAPHLLTSACAAAGWCPVGRVLALRHGWISMGQLAAETAGQALAESSLPAEALGAGAWG